MNIKHIIKNAIKTFFKKTGFESKNYYHEYLQKTIEKNELENKIQKIFQVFPWVDFLSVLDIAQRNNLFQLVQHSKSQLGQDLFVALNTWNLSESKFFVEFGATDGVYHSNTWLLEKSLGWSGILAEPCKSWHANLFKERNCIIDTRCVAPESGKQVDFLEIDGAREKMELSVISSYANSDCHLQARAGKKKSYNVETTSLNDLLAYHRAPKRINYLSIDTEGSEYDIIKNFDFSKYQIDIITIEHNFKQGTRNQILKLLNEAGFERIFCDVSKFDDWYVAIKN